jgi:hypothetical protein
MLITFVNDLYCSGFLIRPVTIPCRPWYRRRTLADSYTQPYGQKTRYVTRCSINWYLRRLGNLPRPSIGAEVLPTRVTVVALAPSEGREHGERTLL